MTENSLQTFADSLHSGWGPLTIDAVAQSVNCYVEHNNFWTLEAA